MVKANKISDRYFGGRTLPDDGTSKASRNARVRSLAATIALFVLFFVAFNRGTYLVLGLVLRGRWEIPRDLNQLAASGVPFLGTFQFDSDALVLGRLRTNLSEGIFSDWPFLQALGSGDSYLSQIGLGGWLITLVPTAFRSADAVGIAMMYCTAAAASAAIAVWVVKAAHRNLPTLGTVLVALTLLQPWIVAIAGSIYWLIGLKLLPAIVLLLLTKYPKLPYWITPTSVAVATGVALASGYEYVTVVFALPLAGVTYNAVRQRLPAPVFAIRMMSTLLSQVAAFAATLVAHFGLLLHLSGNISSAVATLESVVSKRTGATSVAVDSVHAQSLQASPTDVLLTYLSMPVFGAPLSIPMVSLFSVGILIAVCLCALPYLDRPASEEGTNRRALGLAWLVALLGPVGWFLLARPHSYSHTHINYALWFLPTVPLGAALLTEPISQWIKRVKQQPILLVAMSVVLAVVSLMFALSFVAMR